MESFFKHLYLILILLGAFLTVNTLHSRCRSSAHCSVNLSALFNLLLQSFFSSPLILRPPISQTNRSRNRPLVVFAIFTPPQVWVRHIAIDVSVCLSICLFVCPLAYRCCVLRTKCSGHENSPSGHTAWQLA